MAAVLALAISYGRLRFELHGAGPLSSYSAVPLVYALCCDGASVRLQRVPQDASYNASYNASCNASCNASPVADNGVRYACRCKTLCHLGPIDSTVNVGPVALGKLREQIQDRFSPSRDLAEHVGYSTRG